MGLLSRRRRRLAEHERTAREIGILGERDPDGELAHPHVCVPPKSHLFAGTGPLVPDDLLHWPIGSEWRCRCRRGWRVETDLVSGGAWRRAPELDLPDPTRAIVR